MKNYQKILTKLLDKEKRKFFDSKPNVASRQSSASVLEAITNNLPELVGGSADLSGSNNTKTKYSTMQLNPQILKEIIFIMEYENMLWLEL